MEALVPWLDLHSVLLEEGCKHTSFGVRVLVVAVTLPSHDLVRHTALHDVDPPNFTQRITRLQIIKQPMNKQKDVLEPTPLVATHFLPVDVVQLRRVGETVLVQHMLDGTRSPPVPTIQRDIGLEHTALLLPLEYDERVGNQLTFTGKS